MRFFFRKKPSAFSVFRQKYGLLVSVMTILTLIAVGSRVPYASLLFGEPDGAETIEQGDASDACSSAGTMFDPARNSAMNNPAVVVEAYLSNVRGITEEHEKHLRSPSRWSCEADSFEELAPDSPALKGVASGLPGWNGKPVTFTSFAPILLELQRAYECRLSELERNALAVVYSDGTDKFMENASPNPANSFHQADRITRFTLAVRNEKRVSRAAVTRTIEAFRSFELAAPFTVELHCLHREATDVRNNLSLLADAVSCMPRIWDAATSLHDRAGE